MNYYDVIPKRRFSHDEATLTYSSQEELPIGSLIKVPFGKSATQAVIVKKTNKPSFKTKPISEALVVEALSPAQTKLMIWISDYYATPIADVMNLFLPKSIEVSQPRKSPTVLSPKRQANKFELTKEQTAALSDISKAFPKTVVLRGVTGSGKTQVYIEAIKKQVAKGHSALVLVPEISLTPQLQAEFANNFAKVFVTHSKMTAAQRRNVWLEVHKCQEPAVVVGPRSALFLPLRNVRMVIVDEFHDPAYKQDQAPKYDAVRVAAMLAKLNQAQLILGSATPPVSESYLAKKTEATIAIMNQAADSQAVTPEFKVVDMRDRSQLSETAWLSKSLKKSLQTTVDRGQQAILFLNRRGTASLALCAECGWNAICPNCHLPLTLHADNHTLKCHVCGHQETIPVACPDCGNSEIIYKGLGTKQIEADVKKLFPSQVVKRFDSDTAKDETLAAIYQQVYDGEVDILVGTQTLVKGLDLPNLTLAAAIAADSGMMIPDYSSDERTFQLIHQLAGRVGRNNKASQVVIQTFSPDHPSIRLAVAGDYEQFYKHEIKQRQQHLYPPFVFMLKLTVTYSSKARAREAASDFAEKLKARASLKVLGPTPAFYERLNGKWRWQIVVKAKSRPELVEIAKNLPSNKWRFDLDPIDLL